MGQDVDTFDIVFNKEGSDTVAYVGVQAYLTTSARSIYKVTKSGSTWTVAQDTGTIWATVRDVEVSLTDGTIFAFETSRAEFISISSKPVFFRTSRDLYL